MLLNLEKNNESTLDIYRFLFFYHSLDNKFLKYKTVLCNSNILRDSTHIPTLFLRLPEIFTILNNDGFPE